MRDQTGNITLTIIKPGAVARNFTAPILSKIDEAGFHIAAMKLTMLTRKEAETFYAIHKGKPFYPNLIDFMTSGPVVVAILEHTNAVEHFRKLIGNTDPEKAEDGTIRKMYAEDITKNAIHGSDSDENAIKEADFFFAYKDRYYKHNMV